MNRSDDIESAIKELHLTTSAETDKHILDDAFTALKKSTQKQWAGTKPHILRMVLRNRILELAGLAAVVLIAFALFFKAPTEQAVTIVQLYEAVEKVSNVSIERFIAGRYEPIQNEWISQTLNIGMFKFGEQFILLDIANKLKKTTSLSSDSVQTVRIPENALAAAKKKVTSSSVLVPFSDMNDIPSAAQWNYVSDPDVAAIVPGTEVYDLIWTTQPPDIEFHKWRYFVDSKTNLPRRVEIYLKQDTEQDFTLHKYGVATYPNEGDIKTLISEIFGPDESRPREPEYIGTPEPR